MNSKEKLIDLSKAKRSYLCVGIDPNDNEFSFSDRNAICDDKILKKCMAVMFDTADQAVAFKFNLAFFLTATDNPKKDLKTLVDYSKELNVFSIIDFKVGDISNTSKQYAKFAFDIVGADAVTLNPYMGSDAIEPFLNYENKMSFVLSKTSNNPDMGLQDIVIDGGFLYEKTIDMIVNLNKKNNNLGFVAGATNTESIKKIRAISDDQWLLIPGVGTQGGDIDAVVKFAKNNFIINVSRQNMYSDSPKESSKLFKNKINSAFE